MSTTHDQLDGILNSIRPTFHKRHLVFHRNGGFNTQDSVRKAISLFHTVQVFKTQVMPKNPLPVADSFGTDCENFITKMNTGNREEFFKSSKALQDLLGEHLTQPRSASPSTASPMNRQVIEVLNDQVHVVLDKRDDLFDNDDPFDEDAFEAANENLIFVRELYIEQLRTNSDQASQEDLDECRDANKSLEEAVGSNFVARIGATATLLESKIKPALA